VIRLHFNVALGLPTMLTVNSHIRIQDSSRSFHS